MENSSNHFIKKVKIKAFIMFALILILLLSSKTTWACTEKEGTEYAYVDTIRTNYDNDPPTVSLTIIYCGNLLKKPADILIDPYHITATAQEPFGSYIWTYALNSEDFSKGGYFPIHVYTENKNITIKNGDDQYAHIKKTRSRHYALFASVILLIVLGFSKKFQKTLSPLGNFVQNNTKKISISIIILFITLILIGITGSSMRFLFDSPSGKSFLQTEGSTWSIKSPHPDRGDEWLVNIPSVLAQVNHSPPFPIVNSNVGLGGQNMGVIGMTGVPIKQIAAIARPATWGYFFLPLRQAMSWHWQLPFFFALLSVWWLLNILSPLASGRNLILALSFCVAPYAAAWSNWPLYATAFPVLGLCLTISLLKAKETWKAVSLGTLLGWAFACWVLVLYPPWIVIVGSLCLLLFIGWALDHKKAIQLRQAQLLGFSFALLVAAGLLYSWWINTQDAIQMIQNSVYPGGRKTETGGDLPLFWSLRGYIGLDTIPHTIGPWTNKPEVSSYLYVPLAIIPILLFGLFKKNRNKWTWIGLSSFFAIYWTYAYIGFPLWLAQITKWGVMTTNRIELGLGLATIVLVALLKNINDKNARENRLFLYGTALTASLASGYLAWWTVGQFPAAVLMLQSDLYKLTMALICSAMAWWMITRNTFALSMSMLVLGLATTLSFNPISKAPKDVFVNSETKKFVEKGNIKYRTLVIDESTAPAMVLEAAGFPVVNGVLYYAQSSIWDSLDLDQNDWPIVNRYQHLIFLPGKTEMRKPFEVTSPGMDHVRVIFNPANFSFAALNAQRIVIYKDLADQLNINPELERLGEHKGYVWFSVK